MLLCIILLSLGSEVLAFYPTFVGTHSSPTSHYSSTNSPFRILEAQYASMPIPCQRGKRKLAWNRPGIELIKINKMRWLINYHHPLLFFGPVLFFITTNWLTTFRSIYGRVPVAVGGKDSTPSEFAFLKIILHCRGLRLVVLATFFVFSGTNLP
jgi:hypothetical protein